jgi:hypothetical protein
MDAPKKMALQLHDRVIMRALLIVSLALISAILSTRADELLPPFGFRWNDSMARVEAVLRGAKAQIVSREKKEGRSGPWKASSIPA